jgi:protein-disulfide isomerase
MKSKSFGLIATIALTLSPVAVFAQETQVNSQGASNSGVAAGHGNTVVQNVDQDSLQKQVDVDGYYHGNDPQLQINSQGASNSGAAIGTGNNVIQNVDQDSLQKQFGY